MVLGSKTRTGLPGPIKRFSRLTPAWPTKGNVVAVPAESYWDDGINNQHKRMEYLDANLEEAAKKNLKMSQQAKGAARKKAVAKRYAPEELICLKGTSNGSYLGAANVFAPIGRFFAEEVVKLQAIHQKKKSHS